MKKQIFNPKLLEYQLNKSTNLINGIQSDLFTCSYCVVRNQCIYAYDKYNIGGDCLESK